MYECDFGKDKYKCTMNCINSRKKITLPKVL